MSGKAKIIQRHLEFRKKFIHQDKMEEFNKFLAEDGRSNYFDESLQLLDRCDLLLKQREDAEFYQKASLTVFKIRMRLLALRGGQPTMGNQEEFFKNQTHKAMVGFVMRLNKNYLMKWHEVPEYNLHVIIKNLGERILHQRTLRSDYADLLNALTWYRTRTKENQHKWSIYVPTHFIKYC
jgi:hypothetical protein